MEKRQANVIKVFYVNQSIKSYFYQAVKSIFKDELSIMLLNRIISDLKRH
jgi:hypothetical protein